MSKYKVNVFVHKKLVCKIVVKGDSVEFKNYTDTTSWLPFGVRNYATYDDLIDFFRSRCVGVSDNPELECRRNNGKRPDDFMWLDFS